MATPEGNRNVSIENDPDEIFKICVQNRHVGSNGVWHGDNPFEFVLPVTLIQLLLAFAVSQVLYRILRPLRTPIFVCNTLGGILVGPSFLGLNKQFKEHLYPPRQAEFLQTVASLGILYVVFMITLKMDIAMTLRAAKRIWPLGIIPFFTTLLVMLGPFLLYTPISSPALNHENSRIFLCLSTSFSFFPVISQALLELNLITSELGQIALSSAMINDALQWVNLGVGSMTRNRGHSIQFLTCYLLMICLCVFIVRPAMLTIMKRTPVGKPVKEIYVVLILVGVLIMAAISDIIGLSFLQGPMLLGLIMPNGAPLGTTLIEKSEVIILQILQPFFFIYIGCSTNVFAIRDWEVIMKLQFILVVGYMAKVLACMLIARTYSIRLKHGLVLGLIMNIKGIIELISYDRMKIFKMLDDQIFSFLVISTLGTTAILTPLIEILYKPHTRLDKSATRHGKMRTIQNTPTNSEFCILPCIHNEANVHCIIALLEACNPTPASPICAYVVHLIELLGKSTPILHRVDKRMRKSLSTNYPTTNHIMRAFENYSKNSCGPVTVMPYINIAPNKNMHEAVCNLAQDMSITFLIIPFHENHQTLGSQMIRDLNTNFQVYAPCTVGILVDRYSQLSTSSIYHHSFHVGIFFIGGADDRETLALAIRMSERADIRVTLFEFLLQNKKLGAIKNQNLDINNKEEEQVEEEEEILEKVLNEGLIDEFKAKNIGNRNVILSEIVVENGVQVLEEIRGLEGNYDLVMVGRSHNMGILGDEEMSNFIENADILGVLGDMLASTEFCDGLVPVLVTQCGGKRNNKHNKELEGVESVSNKPLLG